MTTSKSLPARPSLESLRKQAKQLARAITAGDASAIARARAQLPKTEMPLSLRDAQLVIAREYGFAGWGDLTAEVNKRVGGLEWAAAQAREIIHANDVERLKQLLADYPALLSWRGGDDGDGLLGFAANAYGDSFDPAREEWFTRLACAELLIDAGAVVTPSVLNGLVDSRARGLLQLFQRKGLLPRTLKFLAALGGIDAVRIALKDSHDLAAINEAFVTACRFQHEAAASLLLERAIALDSELGKRIDDSVGRIPFIKFFVEKAPDPTRGALGPWQTFAMEQVERTIHERDATAFTRNLQREPWLLGEAFVEFQARLIEIATLNDRAEFISALFDLSPAILRHQPPPASQTIETAFTYANTHLIPLLTRVWPVPDDLPSAAGMGNLSRVKQWFDESGALIGPEHHYPYNDPRARGHLRWFPPTAQQVLDVALAYSVINRHFDVADFLLAHGANINTNWNSHEPASILHHLVFLPRNYESMHFLIDRGMDLTIKDYRWNGTPRSWALYALQDEKMAQWLEEAERQQRK